MQKQFLQADVDHVDRVIMEAAAVCQSQAMAWGSKPFDAEMSSNVAAEGGSGSIDHGRCCCMSVLVAGVGSHAS